MTYSDVGIASWQQDYSMTGMGYSKQLGFSEFDEAIQDYGVFSPSA